MDYKFNANRDGTIGYYIRGGNNAWNHQGDLTLDEAKAKQAKLAQDRYAVQHDRIPWNR